ncbi:MAG TPA: 1-(5-phosphoribosyl)-5-[(5-phosphoribosylamino)methylideneamino]imidazole-4-carboxamide isomerase [Clostridiales bacterium]|nr:1-(5-phosphoribosyl)-5-[(5-phosphoribosylamino)methylideneamino]imidazole-4-carboxamide isomerase [Clostridiales bacterium]
MIVFPAIDILDNQCVRLYKGDPTQKTVYGDPLEKAKIFEQAGAQYLHIVDLNAAFDSDDKTNFETIKKITSYVNIPVQLGGGIRSLDDISYRIEVLGAERVILGTIAYSSPYILKEALKRFSDKIVVGMDAKDGFLAIKGWQEITQKDVLRLGSELKDIGVKTVLFTDISRDGVLSGINIPKTIQIQNQCGLDVIASGGAKDMNDIEELSKANIYGVILGKSLYENKIDLKKAIERSKQC